MVLAMRIDDIDRSIIVELQMDGRRAVREIARNLGIAEATVRLRLSRLQDEGILQIVAFADPTKLGPSHMALLFVATDPAFQQAAVDLLKGWTEVSYLSTTLGDADICVQVVCADQTSLWALSQKVRKIGGVTSVRILDEVEVHKIRFMLPAEELPENR